MRELPQEDAEGVDVARRVVDPLDRLVGALDHLGRHVPQRPHGVGAVGAVGATGTMELLLPSALWVRSGASPSNKYDRSLKSSLLSV